MALALAGLAQGQQDSSYNGYTNRANNSNEGSLTSSAQTDGSSAPPQLRQPNNEPTTRQDTRSKRDTRSDRDRNQRDGQREQHLVPHLQGPEGLCRRPEQFRAA